MNILQEYTHIAVKGEGYFSYVTKYQHKNTKEYVAVKKIKKDLLNDPDVIKRFNREIEILLELKKENNIISLIQYDYENHVYIMPFADFNLHDYIKRNNDELSVNDRILLFDQIIEAIKAAHFKGILHRDICPQNILLFQNGNNIVVKVADFGLGKDTNTITKYTRSSIDYLGHVYYVAPEQREKLKNATNKSDIYSMGKLLNFIMTGKDPDILYHCDFSTLIIRATENDPNQRFDNIEMLEKMYNDIKEIIIDDNDIEGKPIPDNFLFDNWHNFHRYALRKVYSGHVYSGYLKQILSILLVGDNLKNYYETVGNSIEDFVKVFVERIEECFHNTGWPFEETISFGTLLKKIYDISSSESVKLLCLKGIWSLAYEHDRWNVQPIMDDLLTNSLIPNELHADFALFIMNSSAEVDLERFSGKNVPPRLKNAIVKKSIT